MERERGKIRGGWVARIQGEGKRGLGYENGKSVKWELLPER